MNNSVILPSEEYWQIQKLVKYIRIGNPTATVIALCAIRDFNLLEEMSQLALWDVDGIEVLVNLLNTEDIRCKIGSLKILREISHNSQISRLIAELGSLQTMVKILESPVKDLKALSAETIANVAKFGKARNIVRQSKGIKILLELLECVPVSAKLSDKEKKDVKVAWRVALALWSCSKSARNKRAIQKAGGIPVLARVLMCPHENILTPLVGILEECVSERHYRTAILTMGMIKGLIKSLRFDNQDLQLNCARTIFKCASKEKRIIYEVHKYKGLEPLVSLLSHVDNKPLLAAAAGAIWKCSISLENVAELQKYKTQEKLVGLLLKQTDEEVLVNVVGALAEGAQVPANRDIIRKRGAMETLVSLLTRTNDALLVNASKAVGVCVIDMKIIDRQNGFSLLWSLLNSSNTRVQASAAWAICPCIDSTRDAGRMVRTFAKGGLEVLVNLLKSPNKEVQVSVCAAIAKIAKDEKNLSVISEHGIMQMLANLADTTDDGLRRHLADAVACCCMQANNRWSFGATGSVPHLVDYLLSMNSSVHRATVQALFELSKEPSNCIIMHQYGTVKLRDSLLSLMGSTDEVIQEASAGCMANIRRKLATILKDPTRLTPHDSSQTPCSPTTLSMQEGCQEDDSGQDREESKSRPEISLKDITTRAIAKLESECDERDEATDGLDDYDLDLDDDDGDGKEDDQAPSEGSTGDQ